MWKKFAVIAFAFSCFGGLAALPKVAVLEASAGTGIDQSAVSPITESITEQIVSAGTFIVLDRNHVDKVLKEQEFDVSSLASEAQAVRAGQFLGADYVLAIQVNILDGAYFLSAKMIEVGTGIIARQSSTQGSGDASLLLGLARDLGRKIADLPSTQVPAAGLKLERRTIRLDGKPDSWGVLAPLYKSDTSQFMGDRRYGIKAFYLCRDDAFFYWRADFQELSPLAQAPKGTDAGISCHLAIDYAPGKRLFFSIYRSRKHDAIFTFYNFIDPRTRKVSPAGPSSAVGYFSGKSIVVGRVSLAAIAEHCRGILPLRFQVGNTNGNDWKEFAETDTYYIDFSD
jgi:hypothetical protein